MNFGGILGMMAAISAITGTVKQVTGTINARIVISMVKQGFVLSKKHGVALIGDLTKGNVEGALTEATQWFMDELQNVEGATVVNNPSSTSSNAPIPISK